MPDAHHQQQVIEELQQENQELHEKNQALQKLIQELQLQRVPANAPSDAAGASGALRCPLP